MADLSPPKQPIEDSGTADIGKRWPTIVFDSDSNACKASSDSDHFSDASEGRLHDQEIPTTRVERVDGQPSYGEVPGTVAYEQRALDAEPDEEEIIPEHSSQPPIPKTVVEKVEPEKPSYGEVPGTLAHEKRKADAQPDSVELAPAVAQDPLDERSLEMHVASNDETQESESNGFGEGDDFDDFEEGGEADDDFGAFDEGTDQDEPDQIVHSSCETVAPTIDHNTLAPPDLTNLHTSREIIETLSAHLKTALPVLDDDDNDNAGSVSGINAAFLTDRSESLWAQLVAPPPLQPPNWVKSRIRRLFLVSLGVPVDLDEILPASKQKKLVLPSMEGGGERHQQRGDERAASRSIDRTRQKNDGSTAPSSAGTKTDKHRRRGPPPPPTFDMNTARLLCLTTSAARANFTVDELEAHNARLTTMKEQAGAVLEYWVQQKNSATGDKEAFEEVIDNLVKHAKRIRK